jgi:hypothetical protein
MIALSSTWREVVMLLVAGGVGLLGGVGAWLLEMKLTASSPTAGKPTSSGAAGFILNAGTAIFLGGVAAVAATYFFQPIKEVENSKHELVRYYELLRLVPLSLLVGTAGTAFLQAMQTRALSTLNAARAETTQATAKAELASVGDEAPKAAKSGIEGSEQLQKVLLDAGVASEETTTVLGKIADQASDAVEERIETQVEAAKRAVAAAAALPGHDPTGGAGKTG